MSYPNLALLDADYFVINIARCCDMEGIEDIPQYVDYCVQEWTPYGCNNVALAFSAPRKSYYRKDLYPSYKSNRDGMEKPRTLEWVKKYCEETYECRTVDKLEADDLLGILCSAGHVIGVSIDKDMRSVPGWHWNPHKEVEPVYVTHQEADLNFHTQWIAGDPVDGFKGVWRVGPKKAVKWLMDAGMDNLTVATMALYEQKGYSYDYCKSMAICARILRSGEIDQDFNPKVFDPFDHVSSLRTKREHL